MKALSALNSFFILIFCLLATNLSSQTFSTDNSESNSLPLVFMLGEKSQAYEKVTPSYQTLLDACQGDMPGAFQKLYSMMKEMEAYAEMADYDLDGVNAWMHFFWNEDGSVDHIGFHLKPNSRNIEVEDFELFLKNFASQYKFPLAVNSQYAHYSTFSFPVR